MYVFRAQYNWLQKQETSISEPVSGGYYSFFYFPTPVEIGLNGELIRTNPHACLISEPGDTRWFYFFQDTRMHWIHGHREMGQLLEKYHIPVGEIFYPKDTSFMPRLFQSILTELYRGALDYKDLADVYLTEMLIKLSRTLAEGKKHPSVNPKERVEIRNLHDEMILSPEKKWQITDMAERVHFSPSRFHATYKAIYGISPMRDIIRIRIERAKELLITQDQMTLPELAEMLGYKSQYHFINQFKSVTGITPGAYRKFNR